MGLIERLQKMELKKLRILAFSFVILSYLFCLGLLYYGGRRLSKSKEIQFPLLSEKPKPLILSGKKTKNIKKYIGKKILIEGKITQVKKYPTTGTLGLKIEPLTVLLLPDVIDKLRSEGRFPENWEGLTIQAFGKIRFDPIYGLEMVIKNKKAIQFVKVKESTKATSSQ